MESKTNFLALSAVVAFGLRRLPRKRARIQRNRPLVAMGGMVWLLDRRTRADGDFSFLAYMRGFFKWETVIDSTMRNRRCGEPEPPGIARGPVRRPQHHTAGPGATGRRSENGYERPEHRWAAIRVPEQARAPEPGRRTLISLSIDVR
jgi:hypothetical protein